MGNRIVIGERDALAIRRQWENEIASKVDADERAFRLVRDVFQRVSEGRLAGVPAASEVVRQPKRDLAEMERQWWEYWYHTLGFAECKVPKPLVSNRDFARWQKCQSGLIYAPAATCKFYEQFMTAVGQGNHWTVIDAGREDIVWEDNTSTSGYWLKVEMSLDCPRLGMSWNTLQRQVRLLVLPEYAIAWYAVRARTGQMLDVNTQNWLASRYKLADGRFGALSAYENAGLVSVGGREPETFCLSYGLVGGRVAEVVKSAA